SLLIQVTHFVHLIHILKRANHLICILGNMCDIFRYQFYINISRFAIAIRYSLFVIHVKRCSPLKPLFIYRGWEGTVTHDICYIVTDILPCEYTLRLSIWREYSKFAFKWSDYLSLYSLFSTFFSN